MNETYSSEKHPKVLISYSHTSPEYKNKVRALATRLMNVSGVIVVLDQWDLKPGMDKYKFMERCVNDPEINKVLILCDRRYVEKADARDGGVGTETSIITPEVFENADQTKFIPVVMERDETGREYLPSYLKSRMYIDYNSGDEHYEELVDMIYDYDGKPELGQIDEKYSHRVSEHDRTRKVKTQIPEQYKDVHISDTVLPDPGEIYKFGSYPQNQTNKKEPIEWTVLRRKGRMCLLISRYALDCKPYNEEWEATTWEKCTLRQWLNRNFYNTAFSEKEKEQIAVTTVTADINRHYNKTNPGRDTKDKIFLLSIQEAEEKKYFSSDEARMCRATPYAKRQGTYTGMNGNCVWWLRSPGGLSNFAANVIVDGSVHFDGINVNYAYFAVRPALWVNL